MYCPQHWGCIYLQDRVRPRGISKRVECIGIGVRLEQNGMEKCGYRRGLGMAPEFFSSLRDWGDGNAFTRGR